MWLIVKAMLVVIKCHIPGLARATYSQRQSPVLHLAKYMPIGFINMIEKIIRKGITIITVFWNPNFLKFLNFLAIIKKRAFRIAEKLKEVMKTYKLWKKYSSYSRYFSLLGLDLGCECLPF